MENITNICQQINMKNIHGINILAVAQNNRIKSVADEIRMTRYISMVRYGSYDCITFDYMASAILLIL